MVTPNQYQIISAAWADARARGLSAGEAWKAASAEWERLEGEERASSRNKPEQPAVVPDDDELIERLCDPHERLHVYAERPGLSQHLAQQRPGPGRPKAVIATGNTWESYVLNELTLLPEPDPRHELVERAEQLAAERGISFLTALATVRAEDPMLAERVYKAMLL